MPLHAASTSAELGGTVSAVTSFGLFVQLDGSAVEGLVHVTELGAEYLSLRRGAPGRGRAQRRALRGRFRGCGVQVSRVDLDGPQDRLSHRRRSATPRVRCRAHGATSSTRRRRARRGRRVSLPPQRADRAVKAAAWRGGRQQDGARGAGWPMPAHRRPGWRGGALSVPPRALHAGARPAIKGPTCTATRPFPMAHWSPGAGAAPRQRRRAGS